MLNCRLDGIVVREQRRSVQIAPWKQQAQPLLGDAHAVDLKLCLDFAGSAEHPVSIEHHQCCLMIVSIGDSRGDDLLSAIAVQIGQRHVGQMPGMPVL